MVEIVGIAQLQTAAVDLGFHGLIQLDAADLRQLAEIGRTHGRAGVFLPVGALGIHENGNIPPAGGGNDRAADLRSQDALAVIGQHHDVDAVQRFVDMAVHKIGERRGIGRLDLTVQPHHLLILGHHPGFGGGGDLRTAVEEAHIGALFPQQLRQLRAVGIVADAGQHPRTGAQGGEIVHHVAGAAQTAALPADVQHGHRRLR